MPPKRTILNTIAIEMPSTALFVSWFLLDLEDSNETCEQGANGFPESPGFPTKEIQCHLEALNGNCPWRKLLDKFNSTKLLRSPISLGT